MTSLGTFVFNKCYALEEVHLPAGITTVPSTAFQYCENLEAVSIPARITLIDQYAFFGCSRLETVVFEGNVLNRIGLKAFDLCTSLDHISFPDSVTSIGNLAFYGCTSLSSLTLPANLTSIGGQAFDGCTGLKGQSLVIPSALTNAYNQSFGDRLFSTIINHSETEFDHYSFLNTETESYEFYVNAEGTRVETIGNGTYTLRNIYLPFGNVAFALPSAAAVIDANAFESDTSITTVDARGCTSIGAEAFKNCTGLTRIRLSQNCAISDSAFDGCTALEAIYAPAGGTTEQWAKAHSIRFVQELQQ